MTTTATRWFVGVGVGALVLAVVSLPALADSSGSTRMGYDWLDNQPPNPGVSFQWVDISASGTRLAEISDCDDCTQIGVPVGFPFPFYGRSYTTVNVNSNGVLQFEDTDDPWGPDNMPTIDFSGPVILPFWSDWDPRSSGDIYAQLVPDWPGLGGRAFVVQWQDVENWDCDNDNATWQAALLEDGRIIFQFLDTVVGDLDCDRGADMTVGVQQAPGRCFITYVNGTASVSDGTAVLWTPRASSCTGQAQPKTTSPPASTETPASDPTPASPDGTGAPVSGYGAPRSPDTLPLAVAAAVALGGAGSCCALAVLVTARRRS